jgi:hypothetical protein
MIRSDWKGREKISQDISSVLEAERDRPQELRVAGGTMEKLI